VNLDDVKQSTPGNELRVVKEEPEANEALIDIF
jgi:hypothetical protein